MRLPGAAFRVSLWCFKLYRIAPCEPVQLESGKDYMGIWKDWTFRNPFYTGLR